MTSGLILILVVTAAYLAAHVAFERLAQRFLIVSGAEYLLLGVLLGPEVSGFIGASVVGGFAPFMTLALGWMGAVVGAQFYLPSMVRTRAVFYRVAFAEALLVFLVCATVLGAAFMWFLSLDFRSVVVPAATLGAIATASASSGVSFVARRMVRRGAIVRQLQIATAVDAAVAISIFGLLLCFAHTVPPEVSRAPTATEWAVITVAIGVAGGALFHLFIQAEKSIDRIFIALAGAIILASGAAAYLRLSPLLCTMLIGAILVNTSPQNREQIRQVLTNVERPLYFVLLIFAGAAWRPSGERYWILPVLLFLLVRYIAKLGSARLAARANGMLPALGKNWGRALLPPGPLAVALALNYLIHDSSLLPNIVFTATAAAVLVTDLMSARLVQSVLRDYLMRALPMREPPPMPPQPGES